MIKLSSKQQERIYLGEFQRLYEGFPKGQVEDDENPDFLVRSSNGLIGIEVTQLFQKGFRNQSMVQRDLERLNVVDIAHRYYDEMGLPPLNVSVLFNEYPPITKENRISLGMRLAELVTEFMPEGEGYRRIRPDGSYEIDLSFNSIRVIRFPQLSKPHWGVASFGFVAEDFSEMIQEIISRKNSRIESYLEKCDHCWLVLVASGFGPSSYFSVSSKTSSHIYESVFEETFYLEIRSDKLICLQTKTSKGNP